MKSKSMNYIDKLKEKYKDDFISAYREYCVSKTVYRTFTINPNCKEEQFKKSVLQESINVNLEKVIKNEFLSFNDMGSMEVRSYAVEHIDLAQQIEISREEIIAIVSGSLSLKLGREQRDVKNWESLESLIIEEKNNLSDVNDSDYQKKLEMFCQKFGFQSVYLNKINSNNAIVQKLDDQFSQLARVMDIQNHQIGLNKINLHINTKLVSNAGHFISEGRILFLDNKLSTDTVAHEWFHAIDHLISQHNGKSEKYLTEDKNSLFFELVEKSKEQKSQVISEINKTLVDDTKVNLTKTIDRALRSSACSNSDELKNIVNKAYISTLSNEDVDMKKIKEQILNLMPNLKTFPSFIAAELTILKNFINKKPSQNSFFYEYSKEIQKHLDDFIKYDYSNSPIELIARMFEGYTDKRLKEMEEENIISQKNNNWTPTEVEVMDLKIHWKDSIDLIRKNINEMSPAKLKIPQLLPLLEKITNQISNSSKINKSLLKIK